MEGPKISSQSSILTLFLKNCAFYNTKKPLLGGNQPRNKFVIFMEEEVQNSQEKLQLEENSRQSRSSRRSQKSREIMEFIEAAEIEKPTIKMEQEFILGECFSLEDDMKILEFFQQNVNKQMPEKIQKELGASMEHIDAHYRQNLQYVTKEELDDYLKKCDNAPSRYYLVFGPSSDGDGKPCIKEIKMRSAIELINAKEAKTHLKKRGRPPGSRKKTEMVPETPPAKTTTIVEEERQPLPSSSHVAGKLPSPLKTISGNPLETKMENNPMNERKPDQSPRLIEPPPGCDKDAIYCYPEDYFPIGEECPPEYYDEENPTRLSNIRNKTCEREKIRLNNWVKYLDSYLKVESDDGIEFNWCEMKDPYLALKKMKHEIARQKDMPVEEVERICEAVTLDLNDLKAYFEGEKSLIWTDLEDNLLRKAVEQNDEMLKQLAVDIKGPERVAKRIEFLAKKEERKLMN